MDIRLYDRLDGFFLKAGAYDGTFIAANVNFNVNKDNTVTLVLNQSEVRTGMYILKSPTQRLFYRLLRSYQINSDKVMCLYGIDYVQNFIAFCYQKNPTLSVSRCHYYEKSLLNIPDDEFEQNLNSTGKWTPVIYEPSFEQFDKNTVFEQLSDIYYVFAANARTNNWRYFENSVGDSNMSETGGAIQLQGGTDDGGFYLIPVLSTTGIARRGRYEYRNNLTLLNNIATKATSNHHREFVGIYKGPLYTDSLLRVRAIWVRWDKDNEGMRWSQLCGYFVGGIKSKITYIQWNWPRITNLGPTTSYNVEERMLMPSADFLVHSRLTSFVKLKIGENIFSLNTFKSQTTITEINELNRFTQVMHLTFNDGIIISNSTWLGCLSFKFSDNFFLFRDGFLEWYAQNQAALNARANGALNQIGNFVTRTFARVAGSFQSLGELAAGNDPNKVEYPDKNETYQLSEWLGRNLIDNTLSWIRGKPTMQQLVTHAKWSQAPTTTNGAANMWQIAHDDATGNRVLMSTADFHYINRLFFEIGFGGVVRYLSFRTAISHLVSIPQNTWINRLNVGITYSYLRLDNAQEISSLFSAWLNDVNAWGISNMSLANNEINSAMQIILNGVFVYGK